MNNNEQQLELFLDPQDYNLLNDIQDSEEGFVVDTYELSDSGLALGVVTDDYVLLTLEEYGMDQFTLTKEDLEYLLKQLEED